MSMKVLTKLIQCLIVFRFTNPDGTVDGKGLIQYVWDNYKIKITPEQVIEAGEAIEGDN